MDAELNEYMCSWTLTGFTTVKAGTEEDALERFQKSKCLLTVNISPKRFDQSTCFQLETESVHKNVESDYSYNVDWSLEGTTNVQAASEEDAREIFKIQHPAFASYEYIHINITQTDVEYTEINELTLNSVNLRWRAGVASA